ncbi:MAG: dethiobiotin synthase [Euryarchaeota archaeon]|nr:dethiobiotin synthase [Euryarchaeota archaeon]
MQGPPGIAITATDTAAGKTTVASALLHHLRSRGVDAVPFKPVETGCPRRRGRPYPQDAARLRRASGTPEPLGAICPYPFHAPLAPLEAARREGRPIEPRRILRAFRALAARHEWVVVETAGGLRVPLTPRCSNRELLHDLGLPALVVVPNWLGAINHTLLTLDSLQGARIPVAGVILNDLRPPRGLAERSNRRVLEGLGIQVCTFPHIPRGRLEATSRRVPWKSILHHCKR